jgi:hypothetical protein
MKKSILIVLLIGILVFTQSAAFALTPNCRTPKTAQVTGEKEGQHSATAIITGVLCHSGQNRNENNLRASVRVKVGVRPGTSEKWYDWTSNSVNNLSSCSKTQKVTPVLHYLKGAEGSWTVVCYLCDVNKRSNSGSITYKAF